METIKRLPRKLKKEIRQICFPSFKKISFVGYLLMYYIIKRNAYISAIKESSSLKNVNWDIANKQELNKEQFLEDKQKLSEDINDLMWNFLRIHGKSMSDIRIDNRYQKTEDNKPMSITTNVEILGNGLR